eukprot:TRINITY_DN2614_c0_g1_i2.p1 TRINITY_DN2614_c0_g1~~TRINITY_DN2614_c0_g1_i2.p1  ORF type:complete len:124 (-),score=27.55 TRINITY_DN2614_c0_g1_i2:56-427(-)
MDKEISEQDFNTELTKYTKVRDRNFVGVAKPSKKQVAISPNTTSTSTLSTTKAPQGTQVSTNPDDFWPQLRALLHRHYPKDASTLLINFQNAHKNYVESLSLDDIERLASSILTLEVKNLGLE